MAWYLSHGEIYFTSYVRNIINYTLESKIGKKEQYLTSHWWLHWKYSNGQ